MDLHHWNQDATVHRNPILYQQQVSGTSDSVTVQTWGDFLTYPTRHTGERWYPGTPATLDS